MGGGWRVTFEAACRESSKCPLLKSQVPTAVFGFPRPTEESFDDEYRPFFCGYRFTSSGTSSLFSERNHSSRCNDENS